MKDFFSPDRVIVGSNDSRTANKVLDLFSQIEAPKVRMSLLAAETTKYAANSYLAVRLSFINEIARLCEAVGADIKEVSHGLAQDKRIGGHFLSPGPGWGGSCFPKDVRAILHTARDYTVELPTVAAAAQSNEIAQDRIVRLAVEILGGNLLGRRIAVWGLTYKANTDDIRESPAVNIIRELANRGASLCGYDPRAIETNIPGFVRAETALSACGDAELLIVLTEWPEFAQVSAHEASMIMNRARILDSRNILNSEDWANFSEYFWANGQSAIQSP
jgi:UDPglucose 6-dehydrogenase